ncbi:hypothetical protein [Rhizobium paknamense]|uniref:Glycosyltransferase n=1 Tax=Rhizobium paknamense TaxID=1206817 RepID=A0ABU0ICS3_9HYPH|nr:hypothetical protein [Rhizobium paknamense]MDQ0455482.1 hypothetical protein [Rhizobium paknamense]
MVSIFCVLRSGGEYKPDHVQRLKQQVIRHYPEADFRCLADCQVDGVTTLPLLHDGPGWWSKMELFRPDIKGDILFMDLDTSIVGDLSDIAAIRELTLMRDIYRPDGLQSSIMVLPEAARAPVWQAWIEQPDHWMRTYEKGGDQAFLERFWLGNAKRFQDLLPGQIVSWKSHVRPAEHDDETGNGTVPDNARIVIFHGKPRPWDIGW